MYSGLLQGFRLHKPLFYIRLQAYVNICLHPIKTFFFPKWSISLECMPPYGRKDLLALLLLHHDFNIIQYPMWPKWCHQKRKVVSGEEQVTTFWWNMKPNFFFLWNMMNRSQWDRKHAIKKKMGFILRLCWLLELFQVKLMQRRICTDELLDRMTASFVLIAQPSS